MTDYPSIHAADESRVAFLLEHFDDGFLAVGRE
jgi:hypothetical protein